MTPAARAAAAIEILDQVADERPVEQVLTRWGRQNRYAGSKDRAAIRDYVYECLRLWRITAHLGAGETGRARMIGLLRHKDINPAELFTGDRHAPQQLSSDEQPPAEPPSAGIKWNIPEWLLPEFERSLATNAENTAFELQNRAPVVLRVNTQKMTLNEAISSLVRDDVLAQPNPIAETALTVTSGERRVRQSQAYLSGGVELQDASSQAVVASLPQARTPLDYCAGGGGKALAMAARYGTQVCAYDKDPKRMADVPQRAERAGARVYCMTANQLEQRAPFDVVLCDAPCSGSGAWRRSPQGKWLLTKEKMHNTMAEQDSILDTARRLVAPGGVLAYATCSILQCENEDRISAFLDRHPNWTVRLQQRIDVSPDGDGFFMAHLTAD